MMNRYRMYNETKGHWEFVISDKIPTILPDYPDKISQVKMAGL